MLDMSPLCATTWWEASCDFGDVYTDTTGGVPTVVEGINAMLASGPDGREAAWLNVEADNSGLLLAGNPRPEPLEAPFEMDNEDTVIVCQ